MASDDRIEFWNFESPLDRFLDSLTLAENPALVISGKRQGPHDFEILELRVASIGRGTKLNQWHFTGRLADGTLVKGEFFNGHGCGWLTPA